MCTKREIVCYTSVFLGSLYPSFQNESKTSQRLELLGVLTATHIAHTRNFQMEIPRAIFRSDTHIVLYRIFSEKKLRTFIANSVHLIKDGVFTDFNFCYSPQNPAHKLTHGVNQSDWNVDMWL